MADLKKLAEEISKLSLVDAVELKNILKDEYGIEPAAGGAVMVAGNVSRRHYLAGWKDRNHYPGSLPATRSIGRDYRFESKLAQRGRNSP